MTVMANSIRVEGIVLDTKNKALPYANIEVLDSKIMATADNNGHYSLTLPSYKKVELKVSTKGYIDKLSIHLI